MQLKKNNALYALLVTTLKLVIVWLVFNFAYLFYYEWAELKNLSIMIIAQVILIRVINELAEECQKDDIEEEIKSLDNIKDKSKPPKD